VATVVSRRRKALTTISHPASRSIASAPRRADWPPPSRQTPN
jgi:hypothetical protein